MLLVLSLFYVIINIINLFNCPYVVLTEDRM
jgi:hypothetical protein